MTVPSYPPANPELPWPTRLRILAPDPGSEPAEVDLAETRRCDRPDAAA